MLSVRDKTHGLPIINDTDSFININNVFKFLQVMHFLLLLFPFFTSIFQFNYIKFLLSKDNI